MILPLRSSSPIRVRYARAEEKWLACIVRFQLTHLSGGIAHLTPLPNLSDTGSDAMVIGAFTCHGGAQLEGAAAGGQRGLALSQCDVRAEH